jgi:hypothetical protein
MPLFCPSREAIADRVFALAAVFALMLAHTVRGDEPSTKPPDRDVREEHAYTLGVQAYVYGYPIVEMYRTRFQRVQDPKNPARVPLNHFSHARRLRGPDDRGVVSPNNDTLYSSAWLDLAHGPIVLHVPEAGDRYRVFQFLDFYTNNFASVGRRTTGNGAGDYAIVGPGWSGKLPTGLKRIDSPTNAVWLLGRTLVDGLDDLPAVHALQDRYTLTSLAARGKKNVEVPTPNPKHAPYDATDPLRFFEFLTAGLSENPPPAREAALLALFEPIGVAPNKRFAVNLLDPATSRGLRRAVEAGRRIVEAGPAKPPAPVNGWQFPPRNIGKFGDDYLLRANTAMKLLAALPPEEAVYLTAESDAQGRPLTGKHRYRLRFEKSQAPPAEAFWSVTLYRLPERFHAANALDRYSIGDRTAGLQYGKDGSLEICIQHAKPAKDRMSNWLPAPDGAFCLTLRAYLPRKELLDGTWKVPPVQRLD